MLDKVDFRKISSVLENSAGKGDLVDAIKEKFKYSKGSYCDRNIILDVDCIELDENLQHILKGKGHRVVHDNYLTYESMKNYSAIIMNPPFSLGDKFLLKAIEMQKDQGGIIITLLNSETLKNPYSNTRKELAQKLEEYNAEIEYIQDAFIDSERNTSVEIALIKIEIIKPEQPSIIIEELRQEEQFREEFHNTSEIITNDFLKGIVQRYNFEVKAGLKLIFEWKTLNDSMFKGISLGLVCDTEDDKNLGIHNSYIKNIRKKYWNTLFESKEFMGLFTSNLRKEYYNKVKELSEYDFSLYNIYTIKIQLNNDMVKSVEETILKLFDELSYQSSWDKEFSRNIHYFTGWKTNSCWKINPRCIIRLQGFNDYDGSIEYGYRVVDKLSDIQKSLNFLDTSLTEDVDIKEALAFARGYEDTKKIQLKHFMVTFYKKGTCHIEFTNLDLLHKFNLFGSQRHNWLPPAYGKKSYTEMTKEEKTIIDEFEGKESYANVMSNTDYFIVETAKLLMLA